MNSTPFISAALPAYEVSYKRKNTMMLVLWSVWVFVCIIHIVKIYNKREGPDYWDAIYPISLIIYLFAITDLLLNKTTFNIYNKQLTVIKRRLFYKKTQIYEIDQMEELEVEQIVMKKYFLYKEPTGEYVITFFYGEKSVELNANMANVHATALLNAILAAKAEG